MKPVTRLDALSPAERVASALPPLHGRVTLQSRHRQPGNTPQRLLAAVAERRVRPGRLRPAAEPVGGGIGLILRSVQLSQAQERLGMMGTQLRGLAQQQLGGVGPVLLPVAEPCGYQVAPQLLAVARDVLLALRRQLFGVAERGIGAAGVADFDVIAAKVVPRRGILVLAVLRDGAVVVTAAVKVVSFAPPESILRNTEPPLTSIFPSGCSAMQRTSPPATPLNDESSAPEGRRRAR